MGCSPWGHEESDTTERLHSHFSLHALEKEMATHSSILAWRTPEMKTVLLRSSQSQREDSIAAAAKSLQPCLTLCDPIDGSPPGFPVPRILQARILEWVAISFSNA